LIGLVRGAAAVVEPSEPKVQKGRDIRTVLRALFEPRHYKALKNIFLYHDHPVDFIGRYIFRVGSYPCLQSLCFNNRKLQLQVFSWHDVLTINEIFFRMDYETSGEEKIIVDFGSNIGISAAFFLSAAEQSFCYLFEPLPTNILRLKQNLSGFEARYKLEGAAVALRDGREEFGFEETGRYGGLGVKTGSYTTVPCLDAITLLRNIVDEHGSIDILKIDIEALELEILAAIPSWLLVKIKKIFVEQTLSNNPLAATHNYVQYGSVAQFSLTSSCGVGA
jgi:FkbM family methyltransferase